MRFCNIPSLAEMLGVNEITIEQDRECEYYIELAGKTSANNNSPEKLLEAMKDMLNKQSSDSSSQSESNSDNTSDNNDSGGQRVVKDFGKGHDQKMTQEIAGDADISKEILNNLLKTVSAQCRGTIPAGIEGIIQELNKPTIIRWQDVLKKYIGRLPIPFKRTRSRLNRRMPKRLDIMGKLPDAYYNIVVAIDTSGSMSDNDVQMCFNEIWGIIESQKKKFDITVIECDSEIQTIYHVKKKRDFKQIKRKGYGGTSFSPVFEYLKENKRKFRDSVVIYFTDGYGERELSTKPLNYNNIWVLTESKNDLSLKEPYGRVLELNLNALREKYNKNK